MCLLCYLELLLLCHIRQSCRASQALMGISAKKQLLQWSFVTSPDCACAELHLLSQYGFIHA